MSTSSAATTEEALALRLSDSQLADVLRLCRPFALPARDALLRILRRGRRDLGDGECMPRVSKWER